MEWFICVSTTSQRSAGYGKLRSDGQFARTVHVAFGIKCSSHLKAMQVERNTCLAIDCYGKCCAGARFLRPWHFLRCMAHISQTCSKMAYPADMDRSYAKISLQQVQVQSQVQLNMRSLPWNSNRISRKGFVAFPATICRKLQIPLLPRWHQSRQGCVNI